jgi:hypothetical protein
MEKEFLSREEVSMSEKIAKSLNTMIALESFLGDLRVTGITNNLRRKDDDKRMEGTRLNSNSHIIKASYVPPCKLLKNNMDVAHIPVPEAEEDPSRMMSAKEAVKFVSKVKKENIKKVSNAILATINNEMRLDLSKCPNQVVFNYEVPVAGLIESAMVTDLCANLQEILYNLEYKAVSVRYTARVIPTVLIKFTL